MIEAKDLLGMEISELDRLEALIPLVRERLELEAKIEAVYLREPKAKKTATIDGAKVELPAGKIPGSQPDTMVDAAKPKNEAPPEVSDDPFPEETTEDPPPRKKTSSRATGAEKEELIEATSDAIKNLGEPSRVKTIAEEVARILVIDDPKSIEGKIKGILSRSRMDENGRFVLVSRGLYSNR